MAKTLVELKKSYEEELDKLRQEIAEIVVKADKLQAKLAVLEDLEQDLNNEDAGDVVAVNPCDEQPADETPNANENAAV